MRLNNILLLGLPCFVLGGNIMARSTPDIDAGCKICYKDTDAEWQKWVADVNAIPAHALKQAALSHRTSFDAGYQPPLCNHAGVNCYYLEPGVDWKPDGGELRKPSGIYRLKDGRTIYAFLYWNNMQKFGGQGGSVNIYSAHCCMELVVNENAKAEVNGRTYSSNGGYKRQGKYCVYDNYAPVKVWLG